MSGPPKTFKFKTCVLAAHSVARLVELVRLRIETKRFDDFTARPPYLCFVPFTGNQLIQIYVVYVFDRDFARFDPSTFPPRIRDVPFGLP